MTNACQVININYRMNEPKADPNITARVICDSINIHGNRLVTMVVTLPKYLVAEFNTHRAFSRNSASSRAIPLKKQIEKIEKNPFVPCRIGKNQKGMQASEWIEGQELENIRGYIASSRHQVIRLIEDLSQHDIHKQTLSRYAEPYLYTTIIVSATSWYNFFALRAHHACEPHFQIAAYRMLDAYLASVPQELDGGQWHIPFGDRMPEGLSDKDKVKIATARCARVSYETFDGEINVNSDIELHDKLAESGHWSPFEHCAMASNELAVRTGNFFGYIQYRYQFDGQNRSRSDTDLKLIQVNKPEWI